MMKTAHDLRKYRGLSKRWQGKRTGTSSRAKAGGGGGIFKATCHHNALAGKQHRLQQYPHKSCRAACFSCLISLTTYRASSSVALVFLYLFVGVLKVQGTGLLFSL